MRIQNPFRLGLIVTLGVGVGLLIWSAVGTLATTLTYIGAALFIALGLDPLVRWLEQRRLPRALAMLLVFLAIIGVFVGLIFAVVPALSQQLTEFFQSAYTYFIGPDFIALRDQVESWAGDYIDVQQMYTQILDFVRDPNNLGNIGSGILSVGLGVANGLVAAFIVIILTLYFTASLPSIKRSMYQFVPATKRARFAELAEQIMLSVGRYISGQASVAAINGIVTFVVFSILQAPFPAVLACISFLLALIPLVGTLTAAAINTLLVFMFGTEGQWIWIGIFAFIYMQVESFVLAPRIMNRAVSVPAPVVVVAALAGGALLGILGALIAIPVAAAIMIIVREVVIPRQNES